MADLTRQAETARRRADLLEAARIQANLDARDAAVEATTLEAQLDAQTRERVYAEHGDPQPAPINRDMSTPEEVVAARQAGAF